MRHVIILFITSILLINHSTTSALAKANTENIIVISSEEVNWGYLNPLRGDKSPGAADLWGDRIKNEATGMLVKFNKGFSSPPHIHNVTYRGIVISGAMHNDDPAADKMWLTPGSYWTQPAGESHITAANGVSNLIYLEIDSGPYKVKPVDQAFDNGERPINVHASNLVWLDKQDSTTILSDNAKITYLWQSADTLSQGVLIKLKAGFNGSFKTKSNEFRAIVITGEVNHSSSESDKPLALTPGSYFSSTNEFKHNLSITKEAVIYVRHRGHFQVSSAE
jgi:mannose-6-phosphate isomerase-like protein (cupin superfamily)